MKEDQPPPPLSFDALRAKAIAAAQDASGKIWTDYNLHDPGVTLLEQTAFALSELAYQGDHAPRDLLTTAQGIFDPGSLALFAADAVLPGRPVTLTDLASCLSALDQLERVFVSEGPNKGMVDLMIIPHDTVDPNAPRNRDLPSWNKTALDAVRARFEENRLLCTAINKVEMATPIPVALHGSLAIDTLALPERVIANAIHRIGLAFKGLLLNHTDQTSITGTTRGDVFKDPAAIWPKIPAGGRAGRPLDIALPALHGIEGLARVLDFELRDPGTDAIIDSPLQGRKATYYQPVLPITGQRFSLTAIRDGAPVQLNNDTLHEELGRLQAARITARNNLRNAQDWDVLRPGKSRHIAPGPIDAMLPAPYRIAERKTRRKGSLTRYRTMMDDHLQRMAQPVDQIDANYVAARQMDMTDPAAIRERITMLDYLISLQGEEMPGFDPATMHAYRSKQQQLSWAINWREDYLRQLPAFNRFSGTAHPQFGFLARLAHLADLQIGSAPTHEGLILDDELALPEPTIAPEDVILPIRPLDTFVVPDQSAAPLSLAKLAIACPWIIDGRIDPGDFIRATRPEAYILARNRKSDWDVLYQPVPGGGFYVCGTHRNRAKVNDWANRLRQTFITLHQQAEQIWCIEDITLRGNAGYFAPFQCTALIPGWTARTRDPSYRHYVTDLILRLAPAHIHVRPLWLCQQQMQVLAPLLLAGDTSDALRQTLSQMSADEART
ncbi:hypothetical protein [Yoonia sp. BS5-3]|uniref:Uncharacterized protein n=1 Tax=Yoonia phaeophyticola TaxID=3137369 RepID=A0ABZ2V3M8_9RHOB